MIVLGVLGINVLLLVISWQLHRILLEVRNISNGDFLTRPINSYGEGIGDAIQGQLVRGQNGISQYDR